MTKIIEEPKKLRVIYAQIPIHHVWQRLKVIRIAYKGKSPHRIPIFKILFNPVLVAKGSNGRVEVRVLQYGQGLTEEEIKYMNEHVKNMDMSKTSWF